MRLARNVVLPAKFCFPFGPRGAIKTSNTWLDKVSFEKSDVWSESIGQCRGKSMASSVPSDALKTKKAGKRISKDVRKSMVKKYVDEYRTMNAGKFPSASNAKKNVGGSYYVVRQILQELKYNSSLNISLQEVSRTWEPEEVLISVKPSLDVLIPGSDSRLEADSFDTSSTTKLEQESGLLAIDVDSLCSRTESDSTNIYDDKRNRVFVDKDNLLSESNEFSSNSVIVNESILNLPIKEPSSLNIESEEGSQSLAESDKSKNSGTQSHHLMDEYEGSLHRDLESPVTNLKEIASQDILKYDELNREDKKQQSKILEVHERELHKVPASAAEPETKSSMWENLKSFATGILGMWRRS